jgi:long-chain acyl-CoA synthetase
MNENSRLFDFIDHQLNRFPKKDMFCGKEKGQWISYSTADVKELVNQLSVGLMKLGVSGNDM